MDENALAEQVSGDDETERSGAVDPGYESEKEAQEVGQEDQANQDEPYSIKKRLGMQAKKHQREMRQLHDRIEQMHAKFRQPLDRKSCELKGLVQNCGPTIVL